MLLKVINQNSKLFSLASFGLILLSILQVAKSTIAEINNNEFLDINPWAFSDLLINYQGGFVRRGLIGEIVFYLDSDGILFDTVYKIIFLNFCIFVILILLNLKILNLNTFQKFLFHISIFGVFNMSLFGNYFARKEIFVINLFLILVIIYKKFSKQIFIYTAHLFSLLAILIHEGIGFFLFYPFVTYLFSKIKNSNKFKYSFRITNLSIFLLIFFFKGNNSIALDIINSLSADDRYLIKNLDQNAITALGWGINEVFNSIYIVLFSGSVVLWIVFFLAIPISISIVLGISFYDLVNKCKKIIYSNYEFLLVPLLFILGWDWGRWILTIFYFLFFVFFLEIDNHQPKNTQSLIVLLFTIISFLTSMPPCCLEMGSTKVSSNIYRIYKSFEITIMSLMN